MHIYMHNYIYIYIYIHTHMYIYAHIYIYIFVCMYIIMYNLYPSAITINKLHISSDIPIMLRFLIWVAIFHLTIARLGGSLLREQGGTESSWRWSGEGESGRGTQVFDFFGGPTRYHGSGKKDVQLTSCVFSEFVFYYSSIHINNMMI